jgi:MoxR-like ATPase
VTAATTAGTATTATPSENRPDQPPDVRSWASGRAQALVGAIGSVVLDRTDRVELVVTAVLAGGHVLLEDLPGTGKTTLARTLAAALGCPWRRIQSTSDLLPADVTGAGMWDPARGGFTFVPGPLFAPVVLVDELNRTPPRTQSAFLEAMDERAVTVDGVRHALPDPFVVVATQNPLDQHGTYPLPEGQLDRFTVALRLGRNSVETERRVLRAALSGVTPEAVAPVLDPAGLRAVRQVVASVHVADAVLDYALGVLEATRRTPRLSLGASSRAGTALLRCAQARALLAGRSHVLPDDVKRLAPAVLGHRVVPADGGGTAPAGGTVPAGGIGTGRGAALVADLAAALPAPV